MVFDATRNKNRLAVIHDVPYCGVIGHQRIIPGEFRRALPDSSHCGDGKDEHQRRGHRQERR